MDIYQVFDRMDSWRHFPDYQLERRADLFFTFYLGAALSDKYPWEFADLVAPEFPVRKGAIDGSDDSNRSFKIDYVAVSVCGTRAALVELKTDDVSVRPGQDKYLDLSRKAGMKALLQGVIDLLCVSKSKRKYFCFLEQLEKMGQVTISEELKSAFAAETLRGLKDKIDGIEIISRVTDCRIVYVKPTGRSADVIDFSEFAKSVEKGGDALSKRFAASLREWAKLKPGCRAI